MSRKGHIDLAGKLEQIEQEQLADELPQLAHDLHREWRERCRQEADIEVLVDGSAAAEVSVESRALRESA